MKGLNGIKKMFGLENLSNEDAINFITTMKDDPNLFSERSTMAYEDLTGVDSELATEAFFEGFNMVKYISDHVPKIEMNPFDRTSVNYSEKDLKEFSRKMEIISEPESILEKMKNLDLTVDDVKIMHSVYPKLLEKIIFEISQLIQEGKLKPDNNMKTMIKLLSLSDGNQSYKEGVEDEDLIDIGADQMHTRSIRPENNSAGLTNVDRVARIGVGRKL